MYINLHTYVNIWIYLWFITIDCLYSKDKMIATIYRKELVDSVM